MKTHDIDISVIVITYNHENYIGHTLESILMQDFEGTMEILVGDDCSTDKTRDVIMEYVNLNPGRITPILREKNLGATKNSIDVIERARGKYLAFLEGDDFWTDNSKLQKQVEFLNENPDVIAVYHRTNIVDQNENPMHEKSSGFIQSEYTTYEYERGIFPGHTSSLVCRNIFATNMDSYRSIMESHPLIGDRTVVLLLLLEGKIKVMVDWMSSYRKVLSMSSENACSVFIKKNMFFEQWKYYDALNSYATSRGSDISMEYLKHLTYVQAVERFLKSRKKVDLEVVKKIKFVCGSKKTYGEFLRRCMFEQVTRRITGKKHTSDMIYYEKINGKIKERK